MTEKNVRVFIADDHPAHRDGVARAISERPGLELVGVAGDRRAAIQGIRDLQPDVAVLDGVTGAEVAEAIAREGLPTTVLLLLKGTAVFLPGDSDPAAISAAAASAGRRGPAAAISDREREVLKLTADGLSGPQIGAVLHLSPTTVKSHLHSVYEKLGVSDRAAAVAVAIRTGLLD